MDRRISKARRTLKDVGEFLNEAADTIAESETLLDMNLDDLDDNEYNELMDDLRQFERSYNKVVSWIEEDDGE